MAHQHPRAVPDNRPIHHRIREADRRLRALRLVEFPITVVIGRVVAELLGGEDLIRARPQGACRAAPCTLFAGSDADQAAVSVVARELDVGITDYHAADARFTGVFGAWIAVLAGYRKASADTARAHIGVCANVSVIAGGRVDGVAT